MDEGIEPLTSLNAPVPSASCAMQSTSTQSLSSFHTDLLVHPYGQQPRMRIQQHSCCRIKSFNAPSCTQMPPCLRLETCTGSLASKASSPCYPSQPSETFTQAQLTGLQGMGTMIWDLMVWMRGTVRWTVSAQLLYR
jgi:hypothetical protein